MTTIAAPSTPAARTRTEGANAPRLEKSESGDYTLHATAKDDQVNVSRVAKDRFQVDVNGQRFAFNRDQASRLTINTGGGADQVNVASNVDVGINVQTGAGDDEVRNRANGTHVRTGDGMDTVDNQADDAVIDTGAGTDFVTSKGSWNIIHTGGDTDGVDATGDNNQVATGTGSDAVSLWGNGNDVWLGSGQDALSGKGDNNNVYVEHNPALRGGQRASDAVMPGTEWDQIGMAGTNNAIDDSASFTWRARRVGDSARDKLAGFGAFLAEKSPEVAAEWNQLVNDYNRRATDTLRKMNR